MSRVFFFLLFICFYQVSNGQAVNGYAELTGTQGTVRATVGGAAKTLQQGSNFKVFSGTGFVYNVKQVSSVKEFENVTSVYPNPCVDYLNIQLSCTLGPNLNFDLIDVTGKEYQMGKMTDSKLSLDLSSLPAGIYFFRLYNSGVLVSVDQVVKSGM